MAKKKAEVVPYNKPSGVSSKEVARRVDMAKGLVPVHKGARAEYALVGRDKEGRKRVPYMGVAGSRGVILPAAQQDTVSVSAKRKSKKKP